MNLYFVHGSGDDARISTPDTHRFAAARRHPRLPARRWRATSATAPSEERINVDAVARGQRRRRRSPRCSPAAPRPSSRRSARSSRPRASGRWATARPVRSPLRLRRAPARAAARRHPRRPRLDAPRSSTDPPSAASQNAVRRTRRIHVRIARFVAGGERRLRHRRRAEVTTPGRIRWSVAVIAGHPFGDRSSSPAYGFRWPRCGCWRRCCRARWSRSAAPTPSTRASWATRWPAEPLMFLKPSTVGDRPGRRDPRCRRSAHDVHHEAELAVVIGACAATFPPSGPTRWSSATRAPTTSRRATCSAATASGPGPRASTPSARSARGSRPSSIRPTCTVECLVGRRGRAGRAYQPTWSFTVAELVAYASQAMTLLPGDVILTGTPAGVST